MLKSVTFSFLFREHGGAYSQAVAVVMQVMKVVNDLIKVPELNQTMQQMSKEMMKAGLIEETMGEMMDDVFDTDDIEEDADAEVDKVGIQTQVLHGDDLYSPALQ